MIIEINYRNFNIVLTFVWNKLLNFEQINKLNHVKLLLFKKFNQTPKEPIVACVVFDERIIFIFTNASDRA